VATEKQHLVDIDACGRYIAGRIGFRAATVEDVMAYMADFADKHTVDAVEVVRCKECRFCKKHPTSDKVKLCTNENWNTEYHPFAYDDGFCSYGERRTDA